MRLMNGIRANNEPALESRAHFVTHGYVHIRGVLPVERVLAVRKAVLAVLSREGWISSGDAEPPVPSLPARRIASAEFFRCIEGMMRLELLHTLAHEPALVETLKLILGRDSFVHPRKMLRITYPFAMNPKDRIPPHQDLFYVKGERDVVTVWVPLGNYGPDHGGLEVLSNSHLGGLLPVRGNEEGRFNCSAADINAQDLQWRSASYAMGDVLLMQALTVHASGINRSSTFRLSVDYRVSPTSGSINEDELLPPYYPNIPSWEELSEGWENRKLFTQAAGLNIESSRSDPAISAQRTSKFIS
jgi:hypothetical protein